MVYADLGDNQRWMVRPNGPSSYLDGGQGPSFFPVLRTTTYRSPIGHSAAPVNHVDPLRIARGPVLDDVAVGS